MRDFKFRAWSGDYFEFGGFNFKTGCLGCNFSSYVELDAPQQFTGLKDKNGVDIYEGDIVIHENGTHEVEYIESEAAFSFSLSGVVSCQEFGVSGDYMEVIGNIYESPELLK